MYLVYFDENKYSTDKPYFLIGGIIFEESLGRQLEKTLRQIQFNFFGTEYLTRNTEFHGRDAFHGKAHFKKHKLAARVGLFEDIVNFVTTNDIQIRMVCINVERHKEQYTYPIPAYRLGLMLFLERCCDYLDKVKDRGLVFGDYEKDEITRSILDFSQFKSVGKTPMYYGRPLGRLLDTIYFTHSHHSCFLQVADMLVYLGGRYLVNPPDLTRWHEEKLSNAWGRVQSHKNYRIQRWL